MGRYTMNTTFQREDQENNTMNELDNIDAANYVTGRVDKLD